MNAPTNQLRRKLKEGLVIPACPLPLDTHRRWSMRHQRALVRYYLESGAGGLAVGVHTTQFEIRKPEHGLYEPVLELVANELESQGRSSKSMEFVRVAGICGETAQAVREAETAARFGFHAGLLSLTAVGHLPEKEILDHCRAVGKAIPLFGFYLQAAVGGHVFGYDFWRRFVEIPAIVAIKMAPFNRYHTWDVVRAVLESGRDDVALYTGNDDNIINDLITPFSAIVEGETRRRFIDGGLLGQWAVWTSRAVSMLAEIRKDRAGDAIPTKWLERNVALTDTNAAVFDAANNFSGCIPGIMEVLRRHGLAPSNHCLDPGEVLSPGQEWEIHRVMQAYPELVDGDFIAANLDRWMS